MRNRPEYDPPQPVLDFLRRCYRFVDQDWPRADQIQGHDQGFEQRFREYLFDELRDWSISNEREFHLGDDLNTASGVVHEIDIVAKHARLVAIVEMKNRGSAASGKNDVIVFFAKIFDYLAVNPMLLSGDICLVFISRHSFDSSGLAACLGLGIHPVAPDLRPLPILIANSNLMQSELNRGLSIDTEQQDRFHDFCALLNQMSAALYDTWLDNRCGMLSEQSLSLRALPPPDVFNLSTQLKTANTESTALFHAFKDASAKEGL